MRAKFLTRIGVALAAILLTALSTAPSARASAPSPDDVTVTNGEYTLASGDTLDGNLVVLGGQVLIEDGADITGDVVVLGGSTVISGQVDGTVSLIGGSLELTETAIVDGDVTRTGGSFDRAAGAEVNGSVTEAPGLTNWVSSLPGVYVSPTDPVPPDNGIASGIFGAFWAIVQAVFWILAVTGLALLVGAFWSDQTARVAVTMRDMPWQSLGMGVLTGIAMPILMIFFVLFALTICLIPFSVLAALIVGVAYTMAWLFGWIALGQLIGLRLTDAFGLRGVNTLAATTGGTFLISVLGYFVAVIPFIGGFFAWFLLPAIGIGAVVFTRFGTQTYVRGTPPPVPPAEALEPPPVV